MEGVHPVPAEADGDLGGLGGMSGSSSTVIVSTVEPPPSSSGLFVRVSTSSVGPLELWEKTVSVVTVMPVWRRRLRLPGASSTEVTVHLAVGSPETDTMEAHSAACFEGPKDSTVSSANPTTILTTSSRAGGGHGGFGATHLGSVEPMY
jgi:hypothetical protein